MICIVYPKWGTLSLYFHVRTNMVLFVKVVITGPLVGQTRTRKKGLKGSQSLRFIVYISKLGFTRDENPFNYCIFFLRYEIENNSKKIKLQISRIFMRV